MGHAHSNTYAVASSEVSEVVDTNYRSFVDSETLIHYLDSEFEIPFDLQERYGQLSLEDSYFSYPESTVAITGLVFMIGTVIGAPFKSAAAAAFTTASGIIGAIAYGLPGFFWSSVARGTILGGVRSLSTQPTLWRFTRDIVAGAYAGIRSGLLISVPTFIASVSPSYDYDSLYNFYYNRIEYHFTLRNTYNRATHGSCLIHFAYNFSEHQPEYERDECYIKAIPSQEQIYAGQEEYTLVKIPQTEEGRLRRGSWFDWIQGQTKVVDTGSIPNVW